MAGFKRVGRSFRKATSIRGSNKKKKAGAKKKTSGKNIRVLQGINLKP